MNPFSWLTDLIDFLGKFIPRILLVRPTEGGVRFRFGKYPKVIGPGIHFYLPIVTEVQVIPVTRQTVNLQSQSLLSRDMEPVVVGGIICYEIFDVSAALLNTYCLDTVICDQSLLAVTEVIFNSSIAEVMTQHKKINRDLRNILAKQLKPFGVKVLFFCLSDYSRCLTIKCIGDTEGKIIPLPQGED